MSLISRINDLVTRIGTEFQSVRTAIAGKADSNHGDHGLATHSASSTAHPRDTRNQVAGSYEYAFTKNTAFNKNFGSISGAVCEGDDSRLDNARTPLAHNQDSSTINESTTQRFVSDTEKNTWNAKVGTSDSRLTDARTPTDNSLTPAKTAAQYKTTITMSALDVNWNSGLRFTKTIAATSTLTFSNLHEGTKFIEITGDFAVIIPTGFTYAGGERADSGATLIQVVCVDSSAPKGWFVLLKAE